MNIKPTWVIAVILFIAGSILTYDALTSSINPCLTVSQAAANPGNFGKEIQILATVNSWSGTEQRPVIW